MTTICTASCTAEDYDLNSNACYFFGDDLLNEIPKRVEIPNLKENGNQPHRATKRAAIDLTQPQNQSCYHLNNIFHEESTMIKTRCRHT